MCSVRKLCCRVTLWKHTSHWLHINESLAFLRSAHSHFSILRPRLHQASAFMAEINNGWKLNFEEIICSGILQRRGHDSRISISICHTCSLATGAAALANVRVCLFQCLDDSEYLLPKSAAADICLAARAFITDSWETPPGLNSLLNSGIRSGSLDHVAQLSLVQYLSNGAPWTKISSTISQDILTHAQRTCTVHYV